MKVVHEYLITKDIHPSQQRISIMEFLFKNRIHPTVEEIFEALNPKMPTLSKTTIYNTLKLFVEKGAVQMIGIDEHNARFDADMESHAHFLCQECGRIYDIALPQHEVETEEGGVRPVLEDFEVKETQIYYKGICPKCKTSEK